ncbi:hypothetical protein QE397_000072 [Rhodococcus sp. SORGH_AS 301]|nr:hypothetical protein [Rhodococcus sp. SORGH_AS_0301]
MPICTNRKSNGADVTDAFFHETLPQRVVFAAGHALSALNAKVATLGARRVLVIAFDRVAAQGRRNYRRPTRRCAPHRGRLAYPGQGGAACAEAVALISGVPVVADPTTFSGSAAIDVGGLTEDGAKMTRLDRRVLRVRPTARRRSAARPGVQRDDRTGRLGSRRAGARNRGRRRGPDGPAHGCPLTALEDLRMPESCAYSRRSPPTTRRRSPRSH